MKVIEYIQFLQEKLQMYEGSYEGWSQEPAKLLPWVNSILNMLLSVWVLLLLINISLLGAIYHHL